MGTGSLCKVSAGLMQIGCHYYFLSPNDGHYARTLIEFHLLPAFEPEWNNYHLSVSIKIHTRISCPDLQLEITKVFFECKMNCNFIPALIKQ